MHSRQFQISRAPVSSLDAAFNRIKPSRQQRGWIAPIPVLMVMPGRPSVAQAVTAADTQPSRFETVRRWFCVPPMAALSFSGSDRCVLCEWTSAVRISGAALNGELSRLHRDVSLALAAGSHHRSPASGRHAKCRHESANRSTTAFASTLCTRP